MACNRPASANATSLYYLIQDTCGELPLNPVFKKLRFTGGVPTLTMDPLTSSELDGSPEITGVRLGSRQVANESGVELYYGAHDDLLESAMQSTWIAGNSIAAQSCQIIAAARELKILGVDESTSLVAGDLIKAESFTLGANNQPMLITTVTFDGTDTIIGIDAAKESNSLIGIVGIEDETVTSDVVTSSKLLISTERKFIALLVEYGDINGGPTYDLVVDNEATGFNFNAAVNAIVTGTINFIGKSMGQNITLPSGTTFVDNNTEKPFTGIDGAIIKNGLPLVLSSGADMTLDRGATASFEIGSKFMSHVSYGKATNEVSIDTFFYDYALSGDYENEVEGDYTIILSLDGKAMAFQYPTALITGLDRDVSEGDITQAATLTPYKPAGQASSLIIHRIE